MKNVTLTLTYQGFTKSGKEVYHVTGDNVKTMQFEAKHLDVVKEKLEAQGYQVKVKSN
jgi:hypothetical protein